MKQCHKPEPILRAVQNPAQEITRTKESPDNAAPWNSTKIICSGMWT